jgi:hypothetical protein
MAVAASAFVAKEASGRRRESPNACRPSQVKMTSQHELLFAKEKGIPVIDIRPPEEFNAAHIPGYDLFSVLGLLARLL